MDAYGYDTTISGVCDAVRLSAHFSGIFVFHTGVGVTLSRQLSGYPTTSISMASRCGYLRSFVMW